MRCELKVHVKPVSTESKFFSLADFLKSFKIRSQGVRGSLSSADKDGGGSSNADVRTFLRKKSDFSVWCVRTDKGRGGQFLAILCGRPLWMAL